ncbi:MAG TPA: peptidylprolyl isomerase [Xanthobacteraceae bacterium]|nr:peptidylprolyl isomerase [Xanthobacteraceae bacterium]
MKLLPLVGEREPSRVQNLRAPLRAVALLGAVTAAAFLGAALPDRAAAQDIENRVTAVDPEIGPPPADPLVAKAEDVEIHQSDVALAEESLGRTLPEPDKLLKREKLIEYLVDSVILAKAALKDNLGSDAEVQQRVEFSRNQALMERLLQVTGRAAATDEAARKAYDEAIAKAGSEPELHLRTILFRFKDAKDDAEVKAAGERADAAFERIAGGEDFATVAKDVSDSNSKQSGGDLGYMTRAQMGKEFADVAFTLDAGGVSHPFKSQFGWHLLKVEDKRTRQPPAFETVRDKFKVLIARQAQLGLIADLRSKARVQIFEQAHKAQEEGSQTAAEPAKPAAPAEPGK